MAASLKRIVKGITYILVEYTGLFLLAGIVWIYFAVSAAVDGSRLNRLPSQLEVQKIIYASSELGGIGSGTNLGGLIVYEMPERIARELLEGWGDASKEYAAFGRSWRSLSAGFDTSMQWPGTELGLSISAPPKISELLWTPQEVNAEFLKLADHSLASSGNWYSQTRGEVLILAPSTRRIIYAYQK